jgi:hypothetical protein
MHDEIQALIDLDKRLIKAKDYTVIDNLGFTGLNKSEPFCIPQELMLEAANRLIKINREKFTYFLRTEIHEQLQKISEPILNHYDLTEPPK